ncbi:hypothetical protein [Pseudomonas sp. PLMAX]|uniref:hypothetical protein n=1 Tax=Pseudomonas sp. PLMAX TaxID=2201998 RepID=UPI0038BD0C74
MAIQMTGTAQIVADMAEELRRRATELDRIATDMLTENDPKMAVEALMSATNLVNLKIDKLVLLPMNQMLREIESLKAQVLAKNESEG